MSKVATDSLDSHYDELARLHPNRLHVLAHLGQSLDGRIATASGHSHYVNGPESLTHLHRLRSLSDAVIIGVETAIADRPRLTTRHVEGPSPVRVIIDPKGRLPADHNLRTDRLSPTIVLTAKPQHAFDVPIPVIGHRVAPTVIIEFLQGEGLHHLLVEGGGRTVSAFLAARALDRLQLAVAPLLIGSGRPSIQLEEILTLDEALKPECRRYQLGNDTLFDLRMRARHDPSIGTTG